MKCRISAHLWNFTKHSGYCQVFFENELAEEATWESYSHPCHVYFASNPEVGFTSTPRKYLKEQRPRLNPATYQLRYEIKMAAQEFCRLCKPKINKPKGGYSATANLIFQSWLKDIKVHVEDWNLTERETIQLVKDFTAERAHDEVKFYMGMIADDQQTFDGLFNHLKGAFQSEETISELISNFYGCQQKKNELEDVFVDDLQILVRMIIGHKPSFREEANKQLKHQYTHKLHDQYYAAIVHSALQTSNPMGSFLPSSMVVWH